MPLYQNLIFLFNSFCSYEYCMSRLDVLNGSVSFHLFQHVVRVQSLGLLGVNGGRYMVPTYIIRMKIRMKIRIHAFWADAMV